MNFQVLIQDNRQIPALMSLLVVQDQEATREDGPAADSVHQLRVHTNSVMEK